ncbi:hypothetical protein Pla22_42550 [Rubripirellula amarantea]|uniref:Uncharacterized protein n=1 Tax=Rubripirellula amarantea TaxID=2527999 RepID=A0A5C5WLH5_9BACT|nr:hypothetical protein [Rubripirellula amarantea]TWT51477.1 hypothetical protein Pla22_42550 [Rubripirellula amarantea]
MNSFRRPGKAIHTRRSDWQSWIAANADLVTASGLPAAAIDTEDSWWYFIDRTYTQAGCLGTDIWFGVDFMTIDQRRSCMQLVDRWIADRASDLDSDGIRHIRRMFGFANDCG